MMDNNSYSYTWHDLVRQYFPDATDERCEFILWNKTSFPFASVERVRFEVKRLSEIKASKDNTLWDTKE